ncbi:MAG: electron transfer flavoprotein subunit beta/FixA family protein [Desulfomonile tiedjei]|uniref:Electron transfer flavoprotein subunit beta n=1 Tax=Desulfomonile tiedjei TaxID=2358 RepID=A0A9D6V4L4_9BACT|nr:electron transfer flavoprotein subunit beta/FixA family protein [Desulfomonile tiedjei]
MKSLVCLKQVPDTETQIKVKPDGTGIATDGIKYVINPYDEFSVEEALRLKEKFKAGEVQILSVGPDRATEAIRTALAMGADKGIHINDEALNQADPFVIAKALAAAAAQVEYDIIFCGHRAIDDDFGEAGAMVAELLGLPQVTLVTKVEISEDKKSAVMERDIEGGKETVEVPLPCVVTSQKGLNEPRYASLPGIMKAKKKPIDKKSAADLGINAEPKLQARNFTMPAERQAGKRYQDMEPADAAKAVVQALRNEAKVI